jgi:hypothetical protein
MWEKGTGTVITLSSMTHKDLLMGNTQINFLDVSRQNFSSNFWYSFLLEAE